MLLDAGLDPKTADMFWRALAFEQDDQGKWLPQSGTPICLIVGTACGLDVPSWSLSALWDLAKEKGIALDFSTAEDTADGIIETLVSKLTQTNR